MLLLWHCQQYCAAKTKNTLLKHFKILEKSTRWIDRLKRDDVIFPILFVIRMIYSVQLGLRWVDDGTDGNIGKTFAKNVLLLLLLLLLRIEGKRRDPGGKGEEDSLYASLLEILDPPLDGNRCYHATQRQIPQIFVSAVNRFNRLTFAACVLPTY